MQYGVRTLLVSVLSVAVAMSLTYGLGMAWRAAAGFGVVAMWLGAAVTGWSIDRFYRRPVVATFALWGGVLAIVLGAHAALMAIGLALRSWFSPDIPM
jgi:hypothetical protein